MKRIIGITACVTGIAHTYIAAEALMEAGKRLQVDVKIETRGAIGVENKLSSKDIEEAIGVIIASDILIQEDWFAHKKIIKVGTQEAIKQPDQLIMTLLENHVNV